MTPGDLNALEALRDRMQHIEATARMVASAAGPGDTLLAIEGIAYAIEEQRERLDAVIDAELALKAA